MDRPCTCAIGVMAKAPMAGRSKTRLCPPLSPDQAAALSAAFLRDVTENIALASQQAPIHGFAAYAPAGSEALLRPHLAAGTSLLLADGSPAMPAGVRGFGRCLLHAMQGMLAAGFGAAIVLNADSPTLPTELLVTAARLLLAPGGARTVLGPAEDGGYYLLGATAPPETMPHETIPPETSPRETASHGTAALAGLFSDIAWSTETVATTTRLRAAALGLEVLTLATWYDVDDAASLDRLLAELGGSRPAGASLGGLRPHAAAATQATLARLGLGAFDPARAADSRAAE